MIGYVAPLYVLSALFWALHLRHVTSWHRLGGPWRPTRSSSRPTRQRGPGLRRAPGRLETLSIACWRRWESPRPGEGPPRPHTPLPAARRSRPSAAVMAAPEAAGPEAADLAGDDLERPAPDGVCQALVLPAGASAKDRTTVLQRTCEDTVLDWLVRRRLIDRRAQEFLEKLAARDCTVVLASRVPCCVGPGHPSSRQQRRRVAAAGMRAQVDSRAGEQEARPAHTLPPSLAPARCGRHPGRSCCVAGGGGAAQRHC